MDRRRGGGDRGRYRSRSPDPYHHFNSSKYAKTGGSGPGLMPSDSADTRHHYSHYDRRRSPGYHNPPPPPPAAMNNSNNNMNNNRTSYRGGGRRSQDRDRDYRRPLFDSPPLHQAAPAPLYPPSPARDGAGWLRPMSNSDRGRDRVISDVGSGGFHAMSPLSGQKRGFSSFSDDVRAPPAPPPPPPERFDGAGFAKLFVGSVPRTATEEEIRPGFDQHGRVLEVALIRDKITGQQQGCCFVKYATSQEADRAIRMLHNQYILPGGVGPIQVRYADGERERLGTAEFKLFVGSLNKHATEKEVEEIFAPFGRVEDVYLMRDEMKQSRGCGFVKYSYREMALAAIDALNGRYTMRGCDQPLTVRFADPKRPRLADSRGTAPPSNGPGLGPQFPPPLIRPPMVHGEPMQDRFPANALQPMSPQKPGLPTVHGFGNHFQPRPADMPGSVNRSSVHSTGPSNPGYAVSSTPMTQLPLPPMASAGQQMSPLQKSLQSPRQLPSSMQLQPPNMPAFVQRPISLPLPRPGGSQVQIPHSAGQPLNQALPSPQLLGSGRQFSASQPQEPLNASSALGQGSPISNLHPRPVSAGVNQQQLLAQQQSLQQPPQQSTSQLAQLLSQQTQTLQASFQSSQQAFSQLQQQFQSMQPSNQSSISQQGVQPTKQPVPWAGAAPQTAGNASGVQPRVDSSNGLPANPATTPTTPAISGIVAQGKRNWTEHISPDGYKYYYNSTTGESKWEKPEELAVHEQQQQQKPPIVQYPQVQPSQSQSLHSVPQRPTHVRNYSQTQLPPHSQAQLQPQNNPPLLQQSSQSLPDFRYPQLLAGSGSKSMNDPGRFQQVQQPPQDWMWNNKPSGT